MPEEEPEYEDIEEIDEDAVSGLSKVSDDDDNKSDDEVDSNLKDSEDELDCFIDKDESTEPLKIDNPDLCRRLEQDPDTSITESLYTIVPDGSAPQLTPDFVVLHILAKELVNIRLPMLSSDVDMSGGQVTGSFSNAVRSSWRLYKSFPKRRLKPAQFDREVLARLADARQDLGVSMLPSL